MNRTTLILLATLMVVPLTASAKSHMDNGLTARFNLGGSVPTGDGSEHLNVGVRVGGAVGYELRLGKKMTLAPQLLLSYRAWSFDGSTDATFSNFIVAPGVQFDQYLMDKGSLWVAAHLGAGNVATSVETQGVTVEDDQWGVAFVVDVGFNYHVLDWLAVGPFIGAAKTVTETSGNTQFGAFSFEFGVQVKGKLL